MKDDFYHIRTNSGFSILGLIEGKRRMTIGKYIQKREFIQLSRGFSFGICIWFSSIFESIWSSCADLRQ